jgi:hypothetical protein
MEYVLSSAGSYRRVSCTTVSPRSRRAVWRRISYSSAFCTNLKEFRFFSSALVPNWLRPRGRSDTLASQRSDPSSMFPSVTPMYTRMVRSVA